MALFVDDILFLPGTIGKIILNTLAQTVEKVAWTEYSRDVKKVLLQARHDLDEGKIDRTTFHKVEKYVFGEMKMARKIITGAKS